jgi:hypothetical protein
MDVDDIVESILSPIVSIVRADYYDGPESEYIVYQYLDERVVSNADNIANCEETTIRVSLYTKSDYKEKKKTIRKALQDAGFTLSSGNKYYDKEIGYTVVVQEAWIAGDSDV